MYIYLKKCSTYVYTNKKYVNILKYMIYRLDIHINIANMKCTEYVCIYRYI